MRRAMATLLILVTACAGNGSSSSVAPTESPDPPTTASTSDTTAAATAPPTTAASSTAPSTAAPATTVAALTGLAYEEVATHLPFPILVTSPPDDPRTFVVTKDGKVWLLGDGGVGSDPFLDISDLVRNEGEQGLLGLAFHPGYAANGRFFVHYTDAGGGGVLAEYRVSDDPARADPGSVRVLLSWDDPAGNHNGGMLQFGPDGMLYLSIGDGGGANDQFGNGQNLDTLFAKILRLDVDRGDPYAIPADNPFAEGGGLPETWAYGLRNPWRFWIDGETIYIGDVGQNAFEEIDAAPSGTGGLNYGWPITEGLHCFQEPDCDTEGLTLPVVEVEHGDGGTCSLTGGVVYRGAAIPELAGRYLYSDYCGGWLRSFLLREGALADQQDWSEQVGYPGSVTSFGVGGDGEVYVTTAEGSVLRIVPVR